VALTERQRPLNAREILLVERGLELLVRNNPVAAEAARLLHLVQSAQAVTLTFAPRSRKDAYGDE